MNFSQALIAAVEAGSSHQEPLDLIHRYQEQGLTSPEIYQYLQQIWLEFGFDSVDAGGRTRDELEFLMERVWFAPPEKGVKL
jgi:hypothetical protein